MLGWWLIGLLAVLNVWAFALMGYDKTQARQHKHRVRERTLFLLSFVGGCIGIWLGMRVFRHKTKHWSFRLFVPVSVLVVAVVYGYLFWLLIR